jgi:hypothetical protein
MSGSAFSGQPFPVPTLRVLKEGNRLSERYGFADLGPTPKGRMVITPPETGRTALPPPAACAFVADETSGVPYVRLRIDLPDGRVALADVTLDSFIRAADELRPRLNAINPFPLL